MLRTGALLEVIGECSAHSKHGEAGEADSTIFLGHGGGAGVGDPNPGGLTHPTVCSDRSRSSVVEVSRLLRGDSGACDAGQADSDAIPSGPKHRQGHFLLVLVLR